MERFNALRKIKNNDDDDMIVENLFYSRKDPFTKKNIVHPVRNQVTIYLFTFD